MATRTAEPKPLKPTSAAAYRKLRQAAPRKTTMVECPSGAVWELAVPDLQGYIATGRIPQSLLVQFLESAEKRGVKPAEIQARAVEIAQDLKTNDQVELLIFMRELVREACVNPRIVIGGVGDDELDPTEVDPADFTFILEWVLKHAGVTGLDGLERFRPRRERRASKSRARRKVRRSTVGAR